MPSDLQPFSPDASEPDRSEDREAAWFGYRLREARKSKHLSLKQLSELTGLSIAMISQIERGISSPSIRSLRQLCRALDVEPGAFFRGESAPPASEIGRIVRRENRRVLSLSLNGVSKQLLTPDRNGTIELMLTTIAPFGSSGPEAYTHKGEDAGIVIKGVLDLYVGDDCHVLKAGDSFRFKSKLPHRFCNSTGEETQIVWAVSPPLY